jgi:hypothetical protein
MCGAVSAHTCTLADEADASGAESARADSPKPNTSTSYLPE